MALSQWLVLSEPDGVRGEALEAAYDMTAVPVVATRSSHTHTVLSLSLPWPLTSESGLYTSQLIGNGRHESRVHVLQYPPYIDLY